MEINAYIGGHQFETKADYTPAQVGGREVEPLDDKFEVTEIRLGGIDVTQLLFEEACDLYDQICGQVETKFREGDL